MKIQGLGQAQDYRAHVLAEMYGLTVDQARALKLGQEVDVEETSLNAGLFDEKLQIAQEVI